MNIVLPQGTIKKGTHFLHTYWRHPRFTASELHTLPQEDTALEHVVTRIAKETVYYRPFYQHGDLGGCVKCKIVDLHRFVLKVL